jgi:hypothetical protein
MDADADTELFSEDDLSSDFVGFRGQLALGLEQGITNAVSFGVIGRLDYWSDFPSIDWTNTIPNVSTGHDDAIANEDFLSLSIGARLTIKLGE